MLGINKKIEPHNYWNCKPYCPTCNIDCEKDYLKLKSIYSTKLGKYQSHYIHKKYPTELIYRVTTRISAREKPQREKYARIKILNEKIAEIVFNQLKKEVKESNKSEFIGV